MYKGFEIIGLSKDSWGGEKYFNKSIEYGKNSLLDYTNLINEELPKLIINDTILDGNRLASDWFKDIKADVFISHSHSDLPLALALAGWLYKYWKIQSFIDSQVWGSADQLLKKIDVKYSRNKLSENNFSYEKRNFTTSHVHNILLMSIARVINQTECFIFLNTNRAIPIKQGIEESTLSPWLYSEIEISSMLKEQPLTRTTYFSKREKTKPLFESATELFNTAYKLNKDHLLPIDKNQLYYLQNNYSSVNKYQLLDLLYELHENKIIL